MRLALPGLLVASDQTRLFFFLLVIAQRHFLLFGLGKPNKKWDCSYINSVRQLKKKHMPGRQRFWGSSKNSVIVTLRLMLHTTFVFVFVSV